MSASTAATLATYGKQVLAAFVDLLLPNRCLGCGQGGEPLCAGCAASLPAQTGFTCIGCSGPSYVGEPCHRCQPASALSGLWVAGAYDHAVVAAAVRQLKYGGVRALAQPLAALAVRFLQVHVAVAHPQLLDFNAVVAVPLHRRRQLERGFNQAELIADAVAGELGLPTAHRCLQRVRYRRPQVELKAAQRRLNLTGAYRAAAAPRRVLLLDDVASTGSTLQSAAAALKAAGAREVWGLVVARG